MRRQFLWLVLIGFLGGCTVYSPHGLPPGHGGIPPGQAKKMGPPTLVVVGTPVLVLVPGTDVAVIRGVDADVFVVKRVYYYHHGGVWYRAAHHRGPWRKIHARHLPHGLRGKSPKALRAKVKVKVNKKRGRGRGGKWGS